ncbi:hypothetical protein M3P05_05475 [Sansalvadorimonas sp. 2012CJ34-2]|uniref:Uncharacterized protein n=1 Tax=Parendozoicomonas callyspongiae TaxID=2942213 RepID=A0ABT0PED6_9GAMM|nr:hypothetical protein [Sansalvadorimonas sp. 2012CJ34-2]MCL6269396.1 hypothetical protein [Sansalvadorimonas sp. 2012CJ34-2]
MLMHCNKEIIIEEYDTVRQYMIDTDLFLHSVLEDYLNNSKAMIEDELRDY